MSLAIKNKKGKVVSKARSQQWVKLWGEEPVGRWCAAVSAARTELGITGFCPVGGSSERGKALYSKAKQLHWTQ